MDYVFYVRVRDDCLQEVFRSTVLARLVYASPAWSGFCSANNVNKLGRFLNRCKPLKYCSPTTPRITEQFDKADQSLFETVLTDRHHVLYRLLPPNKTDQYTLRPRYHSLTVSCKSSFYDNCSFISRIVTVITRPRNCASGKF